jgi:NOL1/NOP2/fmu family ribosome biogenesis protein
LAGEAERGELFSYLEVRFGIPEVLFREYLLFKGKGGWWLMRNQSPLMAASQLKVWKTGLKAFRRVGSFVKPTTRMIQVFGHAATKGRVEIGGGELARLLTGEELPVSMDMANGYVILVLERVHVLGLGLMIQGRVRSQLPHKEFRRTMLNDLDAEGFGR